MIKIEYDGKYPNLCSGNLIVIIDDKKWQFPRRCLRSGGEINWSEGDWEVLCWPEEFPENLKAVVVTEINKQIPPGCCRGCF